MCYSEAALGCFPVFEEFEDLGLLK